MQTPDSRGFGSRLIKRGLSAKLGGVARLRYPEGGVICEITALVPEAGDDCLDPRGGAA